MGKNSTIEWTHHTFNPLIYPPASSGEATYLAEARQFAIQVPSIFWNVAGNVRTLKNLENSAPHNLTYSIGRPLIADPRFIQKSLEGSADKIAHCIYAGHCHYFTRGQAHISCKVNRNV
jgi:2,4-dienoyl-CoA reductase-like NADH-dependent reductase (Old Yellow Enzyme family)